MKYTADCPACAYEFAILSEVHARNGLKCPKCSTGFVPEKIHRLEPSPEEVEQKRSDAERGAQVRLRDELEKDANSCFTFGSAMIVACGFLVLVGFANEMNPMAFAAAGGCLSLALIGFFFSQCLHIRAALQKIYLKE